MPVEPRPSIGDSSWFLHDRFGLFIHWGIYALAARHEWVCLQPRLLWGLSHRLSRYASTDAASLRCR